MASPVLSRRALPGGAQLTLCRCCFQRGLGLSGRQQQRDISQKWLAKQEQFESEWQERASRIKRGELANPWDVLRERGFIKDVAGEESKIRELMRRKRIGVYVGIDPTAPALHLGHLLPLMALFWLYMHGYYAIAVIGGTTAKIGDPTDRLTGRPTISNSDMAYNITKMHYGIKRLFHNVRGAANPHGFEIQPHFKRALWNNSQWHTATSFSDVVARLFKGVRLGTMLAKDSVRLRQESGDGMSLGEFVYPLIQAWDWWHMFKNPGMQVRMQIGGSDQYGNIVLGVDAVKHLRDTEPMDGQKTPKDLLHTPVGFTVPLLTDSSGAKFGKSSGNAIWLDPFKTSSFDLYGYFMRRPDPDVERLLRLLTFLPLDKIQQLMAEHDKDPSKRPAHHSLAFEVVSLAHGAALAKEAQSQHSQLYNKDSTAVLPAQPELQQYPVGGSPASIDVATSFKSDIELPESLIFGKSIARILYAAGLVSSVTDGHRLAKKQGAYIGGAPGEHSATNKGISYGSLSFTPIKNWLPQDTRNFVVGGDLLILRRGKHFIKIIKILPDDQWERTGQTHLGEPMKGKVRLMRQELRNLTESTGPDGKPIDLKLDTDDLKEMLDHADKALADDKQSDTRPPAIDPKTGEPRIVFPALDEASSAVRRSGRSARKPFTPAWLRRREQERKALEKRLVLAKAQMTMQTCNETLSTLKQTLGGRNES